MTTLALVALVGFGAELLGGALGMGYGVTSTAMLLLVGLPPAAASASVHLAECGTQAASGLAHWRLSNIDWKLTLRLGIPGGVGAFAGAVLLSQLSTKAAAPLMNVLLLALGVYILARFALRPPDVSTATTSGHGAGFLVPLGLAGGFIDATGGGGWGPVTTSTLLGAARTAPRTVIGSVDASKFIVSVAATLGFLVSTAHDNFRLPIVGALLLGGVLAAPLGAWLAKHLPAPLLGSLVGGFVVLLSLRSLLAPLPAGGRVAAWVAFALVWGWAISRGVRRARTVAAAGGSVAAGPSPVAPQVVDAGV